MTKLAWLVMAAACGAPATTAPPKLENTARPVTATATVSERDQLVVAVLERWADDPTTFPDSQMMEDGQTVALVELDGVPFDVKHADTPKLHDRLVWMTMAQIQKQADRDDNNVAFLRFHAIRIDGNKAEVSIGGDIAIPKQRQASVVKMCCCSATDVWEKRPAGWTFVRRGVAVCA